MGKVIAHIVHADKFTVGYVNFMQLYLSEYKHVFILSVNADKTGYAEGTNIIWIDRLKDFIKNRHLRNTLKECDKIIVTGVFGNQNGVALFYPLLLKKTYLQFWGADLYSLSNSAKGIKNRIFKLLKVQTIKHCKAWINLIPNDYDELSKIVGREKKHFVAPMFGDPLKQISLEKYIHETGDGICKILVGNSATETNCHEDAFKLLERFKDEDIEVYCPLSYGNSEKYKKMVISTGKEIFGDKFIPILDFMEKEEYIKLLSTMNIGVFANNRQQAMGNISVMLGLGKKVYMRDDTSMWAAYNEYGYTVYPTNLLATTDFNQIKFIDSVSWNKNINIQKQRVDPAISINQWKVVFEDE